MKHRLTPFLALAAIVALPAVASASEGIMPRDTDSVRTTASTQALIYPDIPAKKTFDDHYAVLVPIAGAVTASHQTALIVPHNNDASQRLASAEISYLASECPAVLSHPAEHTAMLDHFCQNGRA